MFHLPAALMRMKPLPCQELDRSHPIAQGMVGCWLFNSAGQIIRNLVGDSIIPVATPNGSPLVCAGKFGIGKSFDGSNDYYHMGVSNLGLNDGTPCAGVAWINTTATNEKSIVSNWTAVVSPGWQWTLGTQTSGKPSILFADNQGSATRHMYGTTV